MSDAENLGAEQYGTVREAAAAYAISERAIIKRLSAGSLAGHRVGKVWRVKLPELGTEPSAPSAEPVRNQNTPLIEALQADLLFLRSELTAQREARDQADSEFRRLLLSRDMEIMRLQGEVQKLLTSEPVNVKAEPAVQDTQESPSAPHTTQELTTVDNPTPEEIQGLDKPVSWWHRVVMKWRGEG